jgi:ergothioneine biosynthesis protein EgtB
MPVDAPLYDRYTSVRGLSCDLCALLKPEDTVVQSMPDVSPSKWHLAHVTWFFERFVLEHFDAGYRPFNDDYDYLFNSYYYSVGRMHARPRRGLITRPGLADVLAYRSHVDAAMLALLSARADEPSIRDRVLLGLNHEQQHQELLLTDIKHVFSCNPLLPALRDDLRTSASAATAPYAFTSGPTGIHAVGSAADGFCFDNELPRHDALLHEHRIGSRLVTNGEFRQFMTDGGYTNPALWLSDGWAVINERGWTRPLYWAEDLESEFTLGGQRDIDEHSPVCHVSYYEADAFARWAGARLPTEFEWEVAAAASGGDANLLDNEAWHPVPAGHSGQFLGDAWEWTSSPYAPYPGFEPLPGSLGEYNGKFMCNQMTVRGGSCVTSREHIRTTYRSFFYPDARWQFLGIRLAKDGNS